MIAFYTTVLHVSQMSGVSWWLLCSGWASDCFWDRLRWPEICRWMCLVVVFPADYQAFFYVCLAAARKRHWLQAFNAGRFREAVYQVRGLRWVGFRNFFLFGFSSTDRRVRRTISATSGWPTTPTIWTSWPESTGGPCRKRSFPNSTPVMNRRTERARRRTSVSDYPTAQRTIGSHSLIVYRFAAECCVASIRSFVVRVQTTRTTS